MELYEDFILDNGYEFKGEIKDKLRLYRSGDRNKHVKATFFLNDGFNATIYSFTGENVLKYADYIKDRNLDIKPKRVKRAKKELNVKYFPTHLLDLSKKSTLEVFITNNLVYTLKASDTFKKYNVIAYGDYTLFPSLETPNSIHSGKLIKYNGLKRDKATRVTSLQYKDNRFKTDLSTSYYFGKHLVSKSSKIVIVESEKTALLLDIFYNDKGFTFVATGSLSNIRRVLLHAKEVGARRVFLLPDRLGFFNWLNTALEIDLGKVSAFADNYLEDKEDVGDILEAFILFSGKYYSDYYKTLLDELINQIDGGKLLTDIASVVDYKAETKGKINIDFITTNSFKGKAESKEYFNSYRFDVAKARGVGEFLKTRVIAEPELDAPRVICETENLAGYDRQFKIIRPAFNIYAKGVDAEELKQAIKSVLTKSRFIVDKLEDNLSLFLIHKDNLYKEIIDTLASKGIVWDWGAIKGDIAPEEVAIEQIDELITLRDWSVKADADVNNILSDIYKIKSLISKTKKLGNINQLIDSNSLIKGYPIDVKAILGTSDVRRSKELKELKDAINQYNEINFTSKRYNVALQYVEMLQELEVNPDISNTELADLLSTSRPTIIKFKSHKIDESTLTSTFARVELAIKGLENSLLKTD